MSAKLLPPVFSPLSDIKKAKHLPAPYKMRRYYLLSEVAVHNTANDCWVSLFGEVCDLTKLIQQNYSAEAEPLIKAAGTDITHWFDPKTGDPKTYSLLRLTAHIYTCLLLGQTPLSMLTSMSRKNYLSLQHRWWKDKAMRIGKLTSKVRRIRIINTLTKDDDIIDVCTEETLNEILDRYIDINKHAASYTWKRLGHPLDMDKTLTENEIPDETEEYLDLGIDEEEYVPAIHLYYNDDLTVA